VLKKGIFYTIMLHDFYA